MRGWELQQAVYAALTGSASLMALATGGVHDHVPQGTGFPYVVVGDELSNPADTDDILGAEHMISVHTWSRYAGMGEARQIMQEVYTALHRSRLVVEGAAFVDCLIDSSQVFLDEDGLTRHGVQRFRVLLFEVTP